MFANLENQCSLFPVSTIYLSTILYIYADGEHPHLLDQEIMTFSCRVDAELIKPIQRLTRSETGLASEDDLYYRGRLLSQMTAIVLQRPALITNVG
jgi:hypothetical protein